MPKNRDWRAALERAGIEILSERNEVSIKCPLHEDNSPSLSINVKKGLWICHAGCGYGRLSSLISRYLGITELAAEVYAIVDEESFLDDMFEEDEEELEEENMSPLSSLPGDNSRVPKWIIDRGFYKTTLKRWECREDHGTLIIPVYNDSIIVGYIRRQIEGYYPKYLYSKGLKKSKLLFGKIDYPEKFVCITEGSLDTMWLWQAGFNSVALLGAYMSEKQELLIKGISTEEIVLCLDNDNAGLASTTDIYGRLKNYFRISFIKLERYKDVQDVRELSEIQTIINNRTVVQMEG